MSPRRWLTGVTASLALHAAGGLLVVMIGSTETSSPILVVDLTAGVRVSEERAEREAPARATTPQRAPASEWARLRGHRSAELGARASVSAAAPPPAPQAAREARPTSEAAARASPSGPEVDHRAREDGPDGDGTGGAVARAPTAVAGHASQLGRAARVGVQFSVSVSDSLGTSDSGGAGTGSGVSGGAPSPGSPAASENERRAAQGQLALAVPGETTGSAAADYGPYLARLRQRIHESLRYPPAARRRALTGTVHMEIVIEPSGAVGQVSVLHSSAHPILDEAAVDAVRNLAPLPLPAGLGPRTLRVRLPVVFKLR